MKTSEIARQLEAHGLLELAHEVATAYHVTIDELLGRGRFQPEALARRELWLRAYALVPSLPRLGQIFDRDHTTILSAVQQAPTWRPRTTRRRPCWAAPPIFPPEGPHRCCDSSPDSSNRQTHRDLTEEQEACR